MQLCSYFPISDSAMCKNKGTNEQMNEGMKKQSKINRTERKEVKKAPDSLAQ